jgi:hypothetical protein
MGADGISGAVPVGSDKAIPVSSIGLIASVGPPAITALSLRKVELYEVGACTAVTGFPGALSVDVSVTGMALGVVLIKVMLLKLSLQENQRMKCR